MFTIPKWVVSDIVLATLVTKSLDNSSIYSVFPHISHDFTMIFPCFARDYIEVLIMGFMNKQSPLGAPCLFCCLMEFHGDEMIGTPERNGI